MICERGRVVAVEASALWVETVSQSSCASCSAKKGCGQGLMNSLHDGRRNQLRIALNGLPASDYPVGSDVDIAIPEAALVGGAFIVYLLPLLSMILGMLAGNSLSGSESVAAVSALVGFLLGLGGVRAHALLSRNSERFQPRLVGHHGRASAEPLQFFEH
ncbi:SoxR reducing system RseC family protein [Spongiibacter sp. UBA1325]|uniref:SoxR reducing system RseC family protein n=1 Tax=Spongiibacter sp. UBA1325 TaxID=1947543 RepID=UPI0025794A7B|nr:SoxR reducing system RseC family protein [Spongiibacter sp. UBA1325]|tara:strand:- start:6103 stop:6582 length:480 start_codon:yes stop_codon:yes gene_type:complete